MSQWDAKSFTEAILARDRVCQHCGGAELLQAHHKEHRANGGSDDPSNGVALCAGCHADEHPDLPRDLFFIKAFGPTNGKGWPATYVAGLLHCHPRSVVRHARKAGIKREGHYWTFTEDDLAILGKKLPKSKDIKPKCQRLKGQLYTTTKFSRETKPLLHLLAALTGETMSQVVDRLVREELKRRNAQETVDTRA